MLLVLAVAALQPAPANAQFGSTGIKLDEFGISPIFQAARNGDWQSVDYLVKAGTNPNQREPDSGQTPLIIATIGRHFDIVETLLKFEAKVDMEDDIGKTALDWAAEVGAYDIVELLLRNNADINHQNREGLTPLMLAVKSSHADIVELILARNPDFDLRDYTGRGPLDWARTQRDRRIVDMLQRAGVSG